MQKTRFKLVLLVSMTCLFLAIGTFISGGRALASQHHPYGNGPKPHITVKILSNTTHLYQHKYVADAVVYGIGFNDCPCICANDCGNNGSVPSNYNTGGNSAPNYNTVPNAAPSCNSCGNTGSVPPNYNAGGNSAPNYNAAPNAAPSCNSCGNTGSVPPNYNAGGNNAPNYNTAPNYNAAPNTTYSAPTNSTCPSYNDCGTSDGCGCNTVNLQSSNATLSAPGANLSQVPVNTFGEFRIVVQVTPKQVQTVPSLWAVNSYNGQSSNTAPVSCCPSLSCC